MTKFRVVGVRNQYSRHPERVVWKFGESEEDFFYQKWNDLEERGFEVWVYTRMDKGIWEEVTA